MVTTMSAIPLSPSRRQAAIPPLQSGDRLTRDEFERRYHAMPKGIKAELIRGVVYLMASPARAFGHGKEQGVVLWWLTSYRMRTPGVEAFDNATVQLDEESEPQPDASMMIGPSRGGQASIGAMGYIEGAPELVVEVAASSVNYDLHDKLEAYRDRGVREYVVWRVLEDAIDWFGLVEGRYVARTPDASGLLKSAVFPGLWLDSTALIADDLTKVLEGLNQGLASPEHAAFVARLNPPAPPAA